MGFISILPLSALLLVISVDGTCAYDILRDGWQYRNDYTYEQEINGWVKVHMIPQTWENARLRCLFEGSTLASPTNYQIRAIMKKNIYDNNIRTIFTGFSALYSRGDFYSIGGISLENAHIPKRWAPGEPNSDGQENCITLDLTGSLADVSCLKVLPFMCMKLNLHFDSAFFKKCGTLDKGYLYDYRTHRCYKLHNYGRTWSNAFLTCSGEGGHLAVINSEIEAKILRTIMAKYPAEMIYAKNEDIFAIGFNDWSQYGDVYMTVHGRTLNESGYAKWANGEPNNNNNDRREYCGAIYRNATLADIRCEDNVPFICERRPGNLQDHKLSSSNEV